MSDNDDLQGCEHCSKEFPIETMTMMGDYWFCQGCYSGWKAEFDKCDHVWEPEESEFGEPGRYCHKCSGFQLLEDTAMASEPKPARPEDLPTATHAGTTTILGIEVRTYRLDDGRAIIHAEDFHKVLAAMGFADDVSGSTERADG